MSTELTVMPSHDEISLAERIATNLAQSGLFKDSRKAAEAFAKIMLGRDLGLSPTQAMISLHVVEGKPELSANLQAQLVKTYRGPDGERYDFKVLTPGEQRDRECEIEFRRREPGGEWEILGTERFTLDDADRAGLTKPTRSGAPSMYAKFPRNMLWARAMSNGVNFHCPEVARGLRVFHEGEIDTAAPLAAPQPPLADVVDLASDDDIQRLVTAAKGLTVAQLREAFFTAALPEPVFPDPFNAVTAERVSVLEAALRELQASGAGESRPDPHPAGSEGMAPGGRTTGVVADPPHDIAATTRAPQPDDGDVAA